MGSEIDTDRFALRAQGCSKCELELAHAKSIAPTNNYYTLV